MTDDTAVAGWAAPMMSSTTNAEAAVLQTHPSWALHQNPERIVIYLELISYWGAASPRSTLVERVIR